MRFAVACPFTAAAVLTRQAFTWLVPVAGVFLRRATPRAGRMLAGAGC